MRKWIYVQVLVDTTELVKGIDADQPRRAILFDAGDIQFASRVVYAVSEEQAYDQGHGQDRVSPLHTERPTYYTMNDFVIDVTEDPSGE